METIKVKFVMHDGWVTALFHSISADSQGNILSYQHFGQHGSASRSLMRCKAATPKQFKSLMLELIQIYHDSILLVDYPKIYLGRNQHNQTIYLSPPSWNCNWYWGFGYLGNSATHYHLSSLATDCNLFDGIKREFPNFNKLDDATLWTFCELVQTAYTLKQTAEVLGRGGSNYTANPLKDLIRDPDYVAKINRALLPSIFAEIYSLF